MKQNYLTAFILFFSVVSFAQLDKDKTGIFGNLKVKTGLSVTYFHNIQGEYSYVLQQNARIEERADNRNGGTLSLVFLFPFGEKQKFNFLLNLPFLDFKNFKKEGINSLESTALFNTQTPYGIGFAWFPFNKSNFFGFTSMLNIGKQKRISKDIIDNIYFPISSYPDYRLQVGMNMPDGILDKYYHTETTLSLNFGVILRF
jgi:hypothetical protein